MWIQNMKMILFHSLHWSLVSCRLYQVQTRGIKAEFFSTASQTHTTNLHQKFAFIFVFEA